MPLFIERKESESWRDCAIRRATEYGLLTEVIADYDASIASGSTEKQACFDALYNWDLLDYDLVED